MYSEISSHHSPEGVVTGEVRGNGSHHSSEGLLQGGEVRGNGSHHYPEGCYREER